MANTSTRVRFKKRNVKALVMQLSGREHPYPVYRMGSTTKYERPEVPGNQYRWI